MGRCSTSETARVPAWSTAAPILRDRPWRSLAKAVSWRLTGTMDTIVVSFFVTGKLELALSIGLVEIVTKMGLYFLHERLWERIRFGRATLPPPDYEI